MRLPHVPLWTGLLLLGCGQPLVSGPESDEPLLTIQGRIDSQAKTLWPGFRVALVWVDPLGQRNDRPSAGRLEGEVLDETSRAYSLGLYAPPPADVVRRFPGRLDGTTTAFAFAFAEIVAYVDFDGDGTFHVGDRSVGSPVAPPDAFAGIAAKHALVYVEQPHLNQRDPPAIPAWDDVLDQAPGYHLVECKDVGFETHSMVPVAAETAVVEINVPNCFPGDQPCVQADFPSGRDCLASHPETPLP
jgi:hypothetical protein